MYYKVVAVNMQSAIVGFLKSGFEADYVCHYGLNKVIVPKIPGTRLFVFGNLAAARIFIKFNSLNLIQMKIFECKVTKPRKIKYVAIFNRFCFAWYWGHHKRLRNMRSAPDGTFTVDSVKLIKEIK